ncbi:uncharacterized protein LOC132619710 [Lycium barbarum]|uniref:uncharacterized protein LOC132619710 n=1 Tax=Lycium barbarum TaxID=112863 RepID=UPI00293E64AD|nr:uncharacterized protein LOC132619710 [Lycium barbarum]
MFANDARPKARFSMWLHFHGRMLTADRLSKWGLAVDPICSLCTAYLETRDHLFMECHFIKLVCNKVLKWAQRKPATTATWDQYLRWVIMNGKGKTQAAGLFRMMLAECVHVVWLERNQRVFEDKSRTSDSIAREIVYMKILIKTTLSQKASNVLDDEY